MAPDRPGWGIPAWTVAASLQREFPNAPIRPTVARELTEWTLGYSDPIRERVRSRG